MELYSDDEAKPSKIDVPFFTDLVLLTEADLHDRGRRQTAKHTLQKNTARFQSCHELLAPPALIDCIADTEVDITDSDLLDVCMIADAQLTTSELELNSVWSKAQTTPSTNKSIVSTIIEDFCSSPSGSDMASSPPSTHNNSIVDTILNDFCSSPSRSDMALPPLPIYNKSIVDTIRDDFCSSPSGSDMATSPSPSDDMPFFFRFRNVPLRTYERKKRETAIQSTKDPILEQLHTAGATLEDWQKPPSVASSGDLSEQEDNAEQAITNCYPVDLNNSQILAENLKSLSAFFCGAAKQSAASDLATPQPEGYELFPTAVGEAKSPGGKDFVEIAQQCFKIVDEIIALRQRCTSSVCRLPFDGEFRGFPLPGEVHVADAPPTSLESANKTKVSPHNMKSTDWLGPYGWDDNNFCEFITNFTTEDFFCPKNCVVPTTAVQLKAKSQEEEEKPTTSAKARELLQERETKPAKADVDSLTDVQFTKWLPAEQHAQPIGCQTWPHADRMPDTNLMSSALGSFATESKTTLGISKEAMRRASKLVVELPELAMPPPTAAFFGFQTASKKDIRISKEAKLRAAKVLAELPELPVKLDNYNEAVPPLLPRKKPTTILKESNASPGRLNEELIMATTSSAAAAGFTVGFHTASKREIHVSEQAKLHAAKILEELPELGEQLDCADAILETPKNSNIKETRVNVEKSSHRAMLSKSHSENNFQSPALQRTASQDDFKLGSSSKAIISRKNLLSLTKRKDKPASTHGDATATTPKQARLSIGSQSPATPQLKEFFDLVESASTPHRSTANGQHENSGMQQITEGDKNTSAIYLDRTADGKKLLKSSKCLATQPSQQPSTKDCITRSSMCGSVSALSPISFPDNCRPSGLRRKTTPTPPNRSKCVFDSY